MPIVKKVIKPLLDSAITLEAALEGIEIPLEIKKNLTIISVQYISFDSRPHEGQLVIHQKVAEELKEIFMHLFALRFPIKSVIPISVYDWDDESSMSDNNTSAFNYRTIFGTEIISNHSRGLAIDINPLLNPCISIEGTLQPVTGKYDPTIPGTLIIDDEVVTLFTSRGWRWLGHRDRKDWQHFDKAELQ